MNPLSGCGQSPPCSPRDGCVDSAASWSAGWHASFLPARLPAVPDGQTALQTTFSRDTPKIRRANSEALLPRRGKQRRPSTPAAPLAPAGQGSAIQRAVYAHHRPNRTEPQHTRPLLVGRVCVNPAPKALAAGTAGWPAAVPLFVIFSSRHLPFSARFTMVYL